MVATAMPPVPLDSNSTDYSGAILINWQPFEQAAPSAALESAGRLGPDH
jgi:hypothetical protein